MLYKFKSASDVPESLIYIQQSIKQKENISEIAEISELSFSRTTVIEPSLMTDTQLLFVKHLSFKYFIAKDQVLAPSNDFI